MERWLDPSGKEVLTEEFDPPTPGLSESRVLQRAREDSNL